MDKRTLTLKALFILMLGLGLLFGGCSQLNTDDSGDGSDLMGPSRGTDDPFGGGFNSGSKMGGGQQPPMNLTRYEYPCSANIPPVGYVFVPIGMDQLVGDEWVFTYIQKSIGGELWWDKSGIVIEPFGVPYSTWIAMTKPIVNEPWIEYEPHGLVFTQPQFARISYAGCTLPPGIEPEDLEIWYFNEEEGIYEYIGGENNLVEQHIDFAIEHFSRYVVAGQP